MTTRIAKIIDVQCSIQRTNPPTLLVSAKGEVTSLDWREAQLLRREYVKPPTNGIWEYDMLAVRPEGPTAPQISSLDASDSWFGYDEKRVKCVRVYGVGRGVKECTVPSGASCNKSFIVVARTVTAGKKCQDCLVVAEDQVYVATHSKVYGPAVKRNCTMWVKKNCK